MPTHALVSLHYASNRRRRACVLVPHFVYGRQAFSPNSSLPLLMCKPELKAFMTIDRNDALRRTCCNYTRHAANKLGTSWQKQQGRWWTEWSGRGRRSGDADPHAVLSC